MSPTNFVRVFEVGPRDGLQNEPQVLPLRYKLELIRGLLSAGVRHLEVGAFVRPDKVPQMADTDLVFKAIRENKLKFGKAEAWSLVPNRKGLERALEVGAMNMALFTAVSDSFNRNNIGMSLEESLREFSEIIRLARLKKSKVHLRGYVSTAFVCPFEGKIAPKKTLKVIERLAKLGIDEISIGDTIGAATPNQVEAVLKPALKLLGPGRVAGHFHDTKGVALANALRALELGVRTLDASAGGLGGCPFAPSASGNLATEDLLFMLHGMGMKTGIDLDQVCETTLKLHSRMHRPITSKYVQSVYIRRQKKSPRLVTCQDLGVLR